MKDPNKKAPKNFTAQKVHRVKGLCVGGHKIKNEQNPRENLTEENYPQEPPQVPKKT